MTSIRNPSGLRLIGDLRQKRHFFIPKNEFVSLYLWKSSENSSNASCNCSRCSRLEDTDGYLHKLSAYYETSRMTDMAEVKKQRWSALVQTRSKVSVMISLNHIKLNIERNKF